MNFNRVVISGLLQSKEYARKVFPHLRREYFSTFEYSYLFGLVKKYAVKYRAIPTRNTLKIELSNQSDLSEDAYKEINDLIDEVFDLDFDFKVEYIIDETERWCKQRALHDSIMKSVELMEKDDGKIEAIPEMMRKALQVQFDTNVGNEFFDESDIEKRWEAYHTKIAKFSTGIDAIDNVTAGGFEPKALTLVFGGTHSGKSAAMVAMSANMVRDGHNVLYITLEMAEGKISQRYEANFFDTEINQVPFLDESTYRGKLAEMKSKGPGRLVVREFPTASINVNHIRSLLEELEIRKEFRPDIIVIDYINLMLSCRYSGDSMYLIVKAIAEEVRGLAVEKDYCIISATQGTRNTNSKKNTDIDLTDVAESNALAATVDCMFGIIFPEELREQGIQVWTTLKNRFGGIVNYKFPIKVNHAKSQIFDHDGGDFQICGNKESQQKVDEEKSRKKSAKLSFKQEKKEFMEDLEGFMEA